LPGGGPALSGLGGGPPTAGGASVVVLPGGRAGSLGTGSGPGGGRGLGGSAPLRGLGLRRQEPDVSVVVIISAARRVPAIAGTAALPGAGRVAFAATAPGRGPAGGAALGLGGVVVAAGLGGPGRRGARRGRGARRAWAVPAVPAHSSPPP